MKPNRITICSTCDYASSNSDAKSFSSQIKNSLDTLELTEQFDVKLVECLGACEAPVTIAFQGQNKASFVFSGVNPNNDLADIISTGKAYLEARDGWIEDARSCGKLRHLLRSRLPVFSAS